MPVSTRKQQQIADRRRNVANLYLRGAWQPEIAKEVGVSQSTISRDLAVVRRQWLKEASRDYDAKVAQELAKIDTVELEAWTEWKKSKDRKRAKKTTKESRKGERVQSVEETTSIETLLPEGRYLEIIQKCIARRCKLMGLDAPERHELTGADGGDLSVTITNKFQTALDKIYGEENNLHIAPFQMASQGHQQSLLPQLAEHTEKGVHNDGNSY